MIKHVLQRITNRFRRKTPRLEGECNQCGDCCRNLTLTDTNGLLTSETAFEALLQRRPEYRIFRLRYQDPLDQVLYFQCSQLGDDNLCQAYGDRPRICRIYPNPRMFAHGARLPQACGYRLAPDSEFQSILRSEKARK